MYNRIKKILRRGSLRWLTRIFFSIRKNVTLSKISFIFIAGLTGVIASYYAKLFTIAEEFMKEVYFNNNFIMIIGTPLCFLVSWIIVILFAKEAKGSGIPQVLYTIEISENLDKQKERRFLSLRTAAVKIISSLTTLLGGGAIGREGPTIQIGACILYSFGKLLHRIFHAEKSFKPKTWLIAGGAAGLAAAFNTPLGGLVYALEELATEGFVKWKNNILIAIIVAGMAALWITGPYLYLGYPHLQRDSLDHLIMIISIAAICGFLGAWFGKLLTKVKNFRTEIKSLPKLALMTIGCGLVIGIWSCHEDIHMWGSGRETILQIFFSKDMPTDQGQMALYRFFAPIITFAAGGAGGIFAPSLAAGATIGHFLSGLFSLTGEEANLLVVIGMVAFLTGVTRTPFTSAVLLLEMCNAHSSIFSMMVASLVAYGIAKLVERNSFYENAKEYYLELDEIAKRPGNF